MTAQVWGTFSVRDHLAHEAFLREVLLFDRLLLPYPNPNSKGEWDRWHHPNPDNPHETWNPQRLDELLTVLGSDQQAGHNGARTAQLSMWDEHTWEQVQSNLEMADMASGNPWHDTRLGLLAAPERPGVVEALAAYPSEALWGAEVRPTREPIIVPPRHPDDAAEAETPALEALVQLARPVLLPRRDVGEIDSLKMVVELSQDDDFKAARTAYFEWFRSFVEPMRAKSGATNLEDLKLDRASVTLAEQELRELIAQELKIVLRDGRKEWFKRGETACMTIGATGSAALATASDYPVAGVVLAAVSLVGWSVGKAAKPKDARSMSGATMFVDPIRQLDWQSPID